MPRLPGHLGSRSPGACPEARAHRRPSKARTGSRSAGGFVTTCVAKGRAWPQAHLKLHNAARSKRISPEPRTVKLAARCWTVDGPVAAVPVARSELDGMNAIAHAGTMACGDCAPAHPLPENHALMAILAIVVLAAIGGAITVWQLRRKHRPARVTDQWSALAVMGELCPHGWNAEITLRGRGAPRLVDAPFSSAPPVAVKWKLYEKDSDRPAVTRWVSASTIDEALQTMVDDRRLDVTLAQIEQSPAGEDDRI